MIGPRFGFTAPGDLAGFPTISAEEPQDLSQEIPYVPPGQISREGLVFRVDVGCRV